jgi:enoyl-CoA hydratase/carnithine racemase
MIEAAAAAAATVLYDVDDEGVLVLTLSRPGRRNMWTVTMEDEFYAGLDRATSDARVRVIVVTGAGHDFCPGLDPDVLDQLRGGSRYTINRRPPEYATHVRAQLSGA